MVVNRGLLAVVLGLALPAAATAAGITAIRLETEPGRTTLKVETDAPVRYRTFTLGEPDRIVLDVVSARLTRSALPLPGGRGAVRLVRAANRHDGSVRIVLDLAARVEPRSTLQTANGRGVNRISMELLTSVPGAKPQQAAVTEAVSALATAAVPATAAGPATAAPTETSAPPQPAVPVVRAPAGPPDELVGRDIVIAVDAGHGGHDPGAHGPRGLKEKEVTLRIAQRLVEVINAEPGMRGFLTRTRDEFLPLRSRMERARAGQADLFISIHADAVRNRRVRGASVYVLSEKGATDEAARRLAARENAADLVGGVSLGDKDPMLRSVLLDLSQNASLSSSIEVGNAILAGLSRVGTVRKRRVMQAPFMVLKSPDVPSVLVETAYISNPDEERNLASDAWRQRLARAIFAGVRHYFYANPPRGTLIAGMSRQRLADGVQHVIRRGETLSHVAHRYNVSVAQLRALNGLHSDRVRPGQVLRIPGTRQT